MLIGILTTRRAGVRDGIVPWAPQPYSLAALSATAFQLDIPATLRIGFVEIVFVFLFIDLFDNIGTLVAVGKKANLFDKMHRIPRVNRILVSDATRHDRRIARGYIDCRELHRKRGGRGRGRTYRRHRDRHGPALRSRAVRRPCCRCDPRRCHRARADHRRRHDGGGRSRRLTGATPRSRFRHSSP